MCKIKLLLIIALLIITSTANGQTINSFENISFQQIVVNNHPVHIIEMRANLSLNTIEYRLEMGMTPVTTYMRIPGPTSLGGGTYTERDFVPKPRYTLYAITTGGAFDGYGLTNLQKLPIIINGKNSSNNARDLFNIETSLSNPLLGTVVDAEIDDPLGATIYFIPNESLSGQSLLTVTAENAKGERLQNSVNIGVNVDSGTKQLTSKICVIPHGVDIELLRPGLPVNHTITNQYSPSGYSWSLKIFNNSTDELVSNQSLFVQSH